ncbi:MAG TPA: 4-hydroxy-tetrahydrodipicolinate reductase [Pirellulales bacterium]|nr:4-hydroxy-tetrahydrodipicolinate reductase [Pirellulales bacterium]
MTRIAIHGAAGRMGQRLVALASADCDLKLVAALDAGNHPRLGQDAGLLAGVGELGVPLVGKLDAPVDVVIDFSAPAGAATILETCLSRGTPLVLATTGLDAAQQARVRDASQRIAVLWSPSMSLAVNLAMKLSAVAAEALKDHASGADVEIIERHHRYKEDSPSGTALKFGEIIAGVMGQKNRRHGREGRVGARPHDEIGYHAVRVGDNPGEHTIIFGLLGETLEITVKATNRDCYAYGALAAAKFLSGKPPGLYGMQDVLEGETWPNANKAISATFVAAM